MKRSVSLIVSLLLTISVIGGMIVAMTSCETVGTTYYISSSEGSDDNTGTSKSSPLKSFEKINSLVLTEGDRILMKRGDVWDSRLEIYGGGSKEHPVIISSYGDQNAPKPIIKLNNTVNDICLLISDSHWTENKKERFNLNANIEVSDLDLRNAYVGILVRENVITGSENLKIHDCDFAEIWCDEMLAPLATANGGSVAKMQELGRMPKGDLCKFERSLGLVSETGGGGDEWLLATAIRFTGYSGKIFTGVELYNLVMDNATVGIEAIRTHGIRVHDVVNTGSYGGPVRFSAGCTDIDVRRVRLLGGSENYTFFGGTCGGFLGAVTDVTVADSEFAYEYNLGENDGCGFDFEYQLKNVNLINNVLHHNDSGALLLMQLPENETHDNVSIDGNLIYANLRRTKNAGYNYDVILYNKNGDGNLTLRDNWFYTREKANGGVTHYYGNLGEQNRIYGTVVSGNVTESLNVYRTRFSFNKDGNGEGFVAHTGSFTVAGGKAVLTAEGKLGAVQLTLPVNGFCYNRLLLNVVNDAAGELCCQYKTTAGTVTTASIKLNGAGGYILPLSDEQIASAMSDIVLLFKPSKAGGSLETDFIQFIPDFEVKTVKSGENTIDVTFGGKCFPMLAIKPDAKNISVAGYTVTGLEKINYNTVRLTVSEKVAGNLKGTSVTAKGDLFIAYFADIINGLDSDRTAAEDAALLGCAAQNFYYNGSVTLASK